MTNPIPSIIPSDTPVQKTKKSLAHSKKTDDDDADDYAESNVGNDDDDNTLIPGYS